MYAQYVTLSPISTFSKIIEKHVSNHLTSYLDNNSLISDNQYGFRQQRSTTAAVLKITDHILHNFDKGNYTIGVFLDLKKAFETVNCSNLLQKLKYLGIKDNALNWFESYLTERQQYVHYQNTSSPKKYLSYSIPQGSTLGPLFFNIYINDITSSTLHLNSILFADDSCFYFSGNDINSVIDTVNSDLLFIDNWLKSNKLSLNLEKSHYIIFNRNKNLPHDLDPLIIDNKIINRINITNFLGIHLNYDLKWHNHINIITNKLHKIKGIMYLTRDLLTRNSLTTIYYSLVYSHLIYGNIIWGRSSKTSLKCLEVAQKSIIRTIMFRGRYEHTNDDFISLGILKLKDINRFSVCQFVFKSLNNLIVPTNYYQLAGNHHAYILRNVTNLELSIPFMGSLQSQSSPSFYGCHEWNNLPLEIRGRASLASFKYNLKKSYIDSYRNS